MTWHPTFTPEDETTAARIVAFTLIFGAGIVAWVAAFWALKTIWRAIVLTWGAV